MAKKFLGFPQGFFWGTASSSHQIEGGQTNNWSQWEQSAVRADALRRKGLNPADFQSGLAANSWERFEDDIAAIKRLNNNAYRFSLEWSRIEPQEGVFDEEALKKYGHFISRLREEGIEPFVTLWHWTIPVWLEALGGWENKKTAGYFQRFTERAVKAFPEVVFWMPLNEPNVFSGDSYMSGKWPPQKKNPIAYLRVYHHLMEGHRLAFKVIKAHNPQAQVGIASNTMFFEGRGLINKVLAAGGNWWWNRYFLNRIGETFDFIGLNYYFHIMVRLFKFAHNSNQARLSDMGWELYPEGLYHLAKELQRYGRPIYITEHGLADEADKNRSWYIKESLAWLQRAISEGVDIKGYFHWSLLDNFEWASGLEKKFGLFAVNRQTWERIPRPSASVYADIAKNNGLEIDE